MRDLQQDLCPNTFGRSLVLQEKPSSTCHEVVILRHNSAYTPGGILIENSTYCAGENEAGVFNYRVYAPRIIPLDFLPDEGPADCFWLGYFHDHFGHFLTSTLQRLWYLSFHKRRYAGYIAPNYNGLGERNGFIAKILNCLKIESDKIISPPENTYLRNITIPEPAFIENAHCYEVWGTFMRDLGRKILGSKQAGSDPRPVFLSRSQMRSGTRRYDGEEEMTEILSKLGIETLHPERLPLEDQLSLWRDHRIFIGFSGSAFMNAAFFQDKIVIILNHDDYIFGTQRMIDDIAGNRAVYLNVASFLTMECAITHRYQISNPQDLAAKIIRVVRHLS